MWANCCHNGVVTVRSTKWPFVYMLDNLSISTLEALHCSFHHSFVVSVLFLMLTLSLILSYLGRLKQSIPEGDGCHSPLFLCCKSIAMIIKLVIEMHFDANNQNRSIK